MDLESSGLTPIDVAFLQSIIMNAYSPKYIESEVYLVTSSENEFISCYLDKMEENKEGRFQRSKRNESLNLKTFLCERHEKPRGKSQGNPSKTRANSCKSYVSFKFTGDGIRKACLVRKNGKHSGHYLDNKQEWKVNRIHPSLVDLIKKLGREGIKKEEIAARVKDWTLKNQEADCLDRRFHPTSQDIRYLMSRVSKKEKNYGAEAKSANASKLAPMEDDSSMKTNVSSRNSQKILGVGIKFQSEDANSFKCIILKKQISLACQPKVELSEPERSVTTTQETEKEPNTKTVCSSMNKEIEPTISTLNISSTLSPSAIPQPSTSDIFVTNTQPSLENMPTSSSSADIILSLSSQQVLPPVPQTLISDKTPKILTLSPASKTLTPTPAQHQTLSQETAKVGVPLFAEVVSSANTLPDPVTQTSEENASNQILLPQFVEITSPVKLISTSSENDSQSLSPKKYPSSNMIAGNLTNKPGSIAMATNEALPISLNEIPPSTVTISLSKGDASLSTVGLTLSSDRLLLTADGIPFTTESILSTNQEIETPGKYTEEVNSTASLPLYTIHYNSLREDSSTISCSNFKPIDSKDETTLEKPSNMEENGSIKKGEFLGQIVESSLLSAKQDLNTADCSQELSQNLPNDNEKYFTENSSELPPANEAQNFQKNTQSENGQKLLESEWTEECNSDNKVLIPDSKNSKTSCLVQANNNKDTKLSLTKDRTCQSALVKEFSQTESSQSKERKQHVKNKLNSQMKRGKSDSLDERPLKKRKVLSSIIPTSDKLKKKRTPIPVSNNNIHSQLKNDNVSEKKVFSHTTPLLLYNISQGRLHRLSITEDEMRRRTSPPEKLNLRALQALLQTHKKKQWKQNLKNKMTDSSIPVNEGQSGHLTAFTRLSEEEASHLEFELLSMVANPNHVKINSIVQELVTEAIPQMETEKEIQARNYLKKLQVTSQTLDEIYQKFLLHSENLSLITHTFGTSCMGVMKSVLDDILEKTMQRIKEELGHSQSYLP